MQQENYKALNEIAKAITSDLETIEHLKSTNSRLSLHISTLEELIRSLKSQM